MFAAYLEKSSKEGPGCTIAMAALENGDVSVD